MTIRSNRMATSFEPCNMQSWFQISRRMEIFVLCTGKRRWNGSLTHQTGLTRLQETRGSLILSLNRQEWSKKIKNNKRRRAYLMTPHKHAVLEVITTISFMLWHVLRRPNRNALLIAITYLHMSRNITLYFTEISIEISNISNSPKLCS